MKLASLSLGVLPFIFSANAQAQAKQDDSIHPNVVMIVVDDMNGYGIKDQYPIVKTPNLDKLKKQSVMFVNAVANSPVCNPSRSSFFSGLYAYHTGAYLNGSDGWNRSGILKQIRSIPECFKDNGYTTWGRGKLFHNPLDSAREYSMWDNRPIYKGGFGPFPEKQYWAGGSKFRSIKPWTGSDTDFPDVKNSDAAIAFLKQDHEKPFYLCYGLWRPHNPYTAPKRFFDMYDQSDIELPKSYKEGDLDDVPYLGRMLVDSLKHYTKGPSDGHVLLKKFLWAYCANTSFADWNIGRVIDALDHSKYADNTIVVLFSDNGFNCGEKERWGKATLWEQSDYVPLLIRTPQRKAAVSKATVGLVDVYPTLVDYCKLESPKQEMDGKSMVSLLTNPDAEWDRPALSMYGVEYSSVRGERYRYIRYPDGSEELYDHQNDPFEFNNIIGQPGTKDIVQKLRKTIPEDWAPSTGGRLEVLRDYDSVMRKRTVWDKKKKKK